MNKLKKLYFMGNAHIDPVWMWRWQEGAAEVKATLRSALDRMNEYPEFIFVCSASQIFEWIEEYDPNMFEEIKERINQGRFVIVGGWFIQPDCNLPCGESFARHGLYGQRYFKEKFGVTARTGYNVDSFGHNANIPQFLKKSGMDYYVAYRPGPHEKDLPSHVFRWRSPDGSEVLFTRLLKGYNTSRGRLANNEKFDEQLDIMNTAAGNDFDAALFPYGVGNHGGGPTKQNLEIIRESVTRRPEYEHVHSNTHDFFELLEKHKDSLQVVTDDLQHHAPGCYSAVSSIKTQIRRAEWDMFAAENYCYMANRLLGKAQPTVKQFSDAWKNILFAHFHDSMGGCSAKSVYDDEDIFLKQSRGMAQKSINSALQTLSWNVDTSDASKGVPIIIFNPHSFPVRTVVQVGKRMDAVYDEQGGLVPVQTVSSPVSRCNRVIGDTAFVAEVPAMGYNTYFYRGEVQKAFSVYHANPADSVPEYVSDVKADGLTMENQNLRVTFNSSTGCIDSLFDKQKGKELLISPGALPVVIDELGYDTWAHGKNFWDNEIAHFSDASVTLLEKGPVRARFKVVSRYNNSTLTQWFTLHSGGETLEVRGRIDWHEKHKMLKLRFPTVYNESPKALYEIPYGCFERPADGEEEPGQSWIAVKQNGEGVALLNDNKYSFSIKGGDLNLSVVRSPYYIDHGRGDQNDAESEYTDQGEHEFCYSIMSFSGDSVSEITKQARLLNMPPFILPENNHNGTLPLSLCGMRVSADNVIVGAWKQSEDGSGMILRIYETDGVETPVIIDGPLLESPLCVTVSPYSIQTYFLKNGVSDWKEVMLTEYDC